MPIYHYRWSADVSFDDEGKHTLTIEKYFEVDVYDGLKDPEKLAESNALIQVEGLRQELFAKYPGKAMDTSLWRRVPE